MPPTGSAIRRSIALPRPATVPQPGGRSVDAVLSGLPSHGWTAGWVGRRDRALLVLWQRAGLTFADIANLTVDDIAIDGGVATVRAGDGDVVTLRITQDGLLCGPCALARWLHALDLSTLHSDGRVVASVIARAVPLTAHSPHVCEGQTAGAHDTSGLPVFPEHDRWGPSTDLPPVQPRATHDLRIPVPGFGRTGQGVGHRTRSDHARSEPNSTPVEHPTGLENRARALMAGLA